MRPPVVQIVERDHGKNSWQRPDAMRFDVAKMTMFLRGIDVRSAEVAGVRRIERAVVVAQDRLSAKWRSIRKHGRRLTKYSFATLQHL